MIENLDHLVLTVKDIETTCLFYSRVLKIEVISFGQNRKALSVGQQKINLHQAGQELNPCAKYPVPGSEDLCFITELSMEYLQEHLEECGVSVELGPVLRTGMFGEMISLYFRDPDGNLVEVSNYPNNR